MILLVSVFSLLLIPMLKTCKILIAEMMSLMILWFISKSMWGMSLESKIFNAVSMFNDNISLSLVLLTLWVCLLMILSISTSKEFLFMGISLMVTLCVLFQTKSMMVFFTMFEASVFPTLIMILGWGSQPERLSALFFFFFYTVLSSIPFLLTILSFKTLSLPIFYNLESNTSMISTISLLLMFLVKMPLFFTHFWLPKAHVEAPVAGSMILAGLLLKMGGYGILRILPLLNPSKSLVSWSVVSISLWGMVMACIMCLISSDLKAVVAYSSVSHMNFLISGCIPSSSISVSGVTMMMISHGVTSSWMFFMVNMLYERSLSRSIFLNKFTLSFLPALSMLWLVSTLMNMGFPPTLNCISEMYLGLSLLKFSLLTIFPLMMYLFFGAFYSVYVYMSVHHSVNLLLKSKMVYPCTHHEFLVCSLHGSLLVLSIFSMNLIFS